MDIINLIDVNHHTHTPVNPFYSVLTHAILFTLPVLLHSARPSYNPSLPHTPSKHHLPLSQQPNTISIPKNKLEIQVAYNLLRDL